jgi:hypothetical protein
VVSSRRKQEARNAVLLELRRKIKAGQFDHGTKNFG